MSRRFTPICSSVVRTSVAALLVLSVGAGVWGQQKPNLVEEGLREQDLTEMLTQYPDIPTRVENRKECPLIIHDAKMKILAGKEYQKLSGLTARPADSYATYPALKVTNRSDQFVTAFAVLLKNERDGKTYFLKRAFNPNTLLEPGGTSTIRSGDWIAGRTQWQSIVGDGGEIITTPFFREEAPTLWLDAGPGVWY